MKLMVVDVVCASYVASQHQPLLEREKAPGDEHNKVPFLHSPRSNDVPGLLVQLHEHIRVFWSFHEHREGWMVRLLQEKVIAHLDADVRARQPKRGPR